VPGVFTFLGIRNETLGSVHGLHTPRFIMDEAQLPLVWLFPDPDPKSQLMLCSAPLCFARQEGARVLLHETSDRLFMGWP